MRTLSAGVALCAALFCFAQVFAESELDSEIDKLFIEASTPEAHHQHLVEPAREKLAELGELAVQRLVSKLSTEDARERHALDDIFKRIGSAAVPALIEALGTDNLSQLRNAARCLGEIGDKSATSALLVLFTHAEHTVRSTAVTSVGNCRDSSAVDDCISLLADSVEPVRKSAAVALGRIADAGAVAALIDALDDHHYSVRMSAAGSLTTMGDPACEALIDVFDDLSRMAMYLAFEVWAGCAYQRAWKLVEAATHSPDRYTRAFAVDALVQINKAAARKRIRKMMSVETDIFARSRLMAAQAVIESGQK